MRVDDEAFASPYGVGLRAYVIGATTIINNAIHIEDWMSFDSCNSTFFQKAL